MTFRLHYTKVPWTMRRHFLCGLSIFRMRKYMEWTFKTSHPSNEIGLHSPKPISRTEARSLESLSDVIIPSELLSTMEATSRVTNRFPSLVYFRIWRVEDSI